MISPGVEISIAGLGGVEEMVRGLSSRPFSFSFSFFISYITS